MKQRFRPVKRVKKTLSKKKNQRRLLLGVGIVLILGLLTALVLAVHRQNEMQADFQNKIQQNQVPKAIFGL